MAHKKIIIAGGGTGGHIFPAVAIANALKQQAPDTEILFVGARGKMEMERIPKAGYRIVGLDIAGFNRSSLFKNLGLPLKLIRSFFQVRRIFREFRPDAVIGVGGYSTFPVLKQAQALDIPNFIHESNSFAGRSNKMLAADATKIFTGTAGMDRFFPAQKIIVTGNPVRKDIAAGQVNRESALEAFGLVSGKTTLLVVGGSLGARSINEAIAAGLDRLQDAGLQLIWQTGKGFDAAKAEAAAGRPGVWAGAFIDRMELAYAAADLVMARAGAMTVAEICVVGKPAIFVPYPFAAEDHQTVNARQLTDQGAARMIPDARVKEEGLAQILTLAADAGQRAAMIEKLAPLSVKDADERIAAEVLQVLNDKK
ncbi:undecaprenyldiphospho-muramoylpentapeptide beta-N-acetylglucosaminyltransferase [Niabella terrae]